MNIVSSDSVDISKNSEAGKAAALALGITEEILNVFPELRPIYTKFINGNIAEARMDYFNSQLYRTVSATSQARKATQQLRPQVYAQEFDAWKQAQRIRMVQKGFIWNADIEKIIESSYLNGDSDPQIDIKVLNSGKMGSNIGGSSLGTVNNLKDYANEQGLGYLLPKSYWAKAGMGLLDGSTTAETIQEEIKNFAISAYPAYAKGIQAGRSFAMQTSASRQMLANILEKDVDTITDDNPLFQKITGYMNPKTQEPEQMPLWMVSKLAKSTDEWLYTDNARNTFDVLTSKVLNDWGLA